MTPRAAARGPSQHMVSRSPGRRSRRRLQGPPPRPHDTATIGAALARAASARASAGREPPAQGRAGKGRWTAALTNRSQPSSSSAPDEAQSAAGPAGGAGREGASGGARQALRRKSELGRRLSAECRRGPGAGDAGAGTVTGAPRPRAGGGLAALAVRAGPAAELPRPPPSTKRRCEACGMRGPFHAAPRLLAGGRLGGAARPWACRASPELGFSSLREPTCRAAVYGAASDGKQVPAGPGSALVGQLGVQPARAFAPQEPQAASAAGEAGRGRRPRTGAVWGQRLSSPRETREQLPYGPWPLAPFAQVRPGPGRPGGAFCAALSRPAWGLRRPVRGRGREAERRRFRPVGPAQRSRRKPGSPR